MFPGDLIADLHYSVHRRCPASGWRIETRTIQDHELVLITAGRGEITIDGKQYAAKPGRLFYFYPALPHALVSDDQDPLQFYALHFGYAQAQFHDGSWALQSDVPLLPLRTSLEVKNLVQATAVMHEINTAFHRVAAQPDLLSRGLLLQLLHLFLQDSRCQDFNYASRLKIEQVIEYIRRHLSSPLTIPMLAALVNLSPDYLTCLFRRYTGQSPLQYINHRRMNAAKILLIEQNLSVKAVAAALGYPDEFYFSRLFRKLEGVSPSAYRRQAGAWL